MNVQFSLDRVITEEFEESKEGTDMEIMSSNSFLMLEKSLGFLWTKQAAILDNISNAETPNYKTKVVTFEETLKDQLEGVARGTGSTTRAAVRNVLEAAEPEVKEQTVSTRMDENGVNVTEESTEMIRNAYQLQYVMQAMNSDLSVLRTAIQA
jgi:flagellar basal-body rod protein FlgB